MGVTLARSPTLAVTAELFCEGLLSAQGPADF